MAGFGTMPGTNYTQTLAKPIPNTPNFTADPNASHVTIDPSILNSMQQYSDAAYQASQRNLDPQWQQKQNQFNQQMVGQGLMPGSEAYNNAYQNFSQSQNDAYSQARNQAMQQGLAAQGQAFGQGFQNSSLANELAKQQMASDAQVSAAGLGAGAQLGSARTAADASMYNNTMDNQTQQLLGYGNLGLGYDTLNQNAGNQNFQNLMQLYGMGQSQDAYNNSLPGMELGNMSSLFGFMPSGNPFQTDVTGAYGLNQSGQNAQYQGQVAGANGTNQMLGGLGSAAATIAIMM